MTNVLSIDPSRVDKDDKREQATLRSLDAWIFEAASSTTETRSRHGKR